MIETAWLPVAGHNLTGRRLTECCNWLAPVDDCEVRHWATYDGYHAGVSWRCAPGKGCHVRPGLRRTAHLRHYDGGDE
jgi:hypothetical protein